MLPICSRFHPSSSPRELSSPRPEATVFRGELTLTGSRDGEPTHAQSNARFLHIDQVANALQYDRTSRLDDALANAAKNKGSATCA